MYVRCINKGCMEHLTKDAVYETNDALHKASIFICADDGLQRCYNSDRFEEVNKVKEPVDLLEATRKFLGR